MSSEPLEVRVLITEIPMYVEKNSKQMDLKDTPVLMTSPIDDILTVETAKTKCKIVATVQGKTGASI